jgi:hypothetical protein
MFPFYKKTVKLIKGFQSICFFCILHSVSTDFATNQVLLPYNMIFVNQTRSESKQRKKEVFSRKFQARFTPFSKRTRCLFQKDAMSSQKQCDVFGKASHCLGRRIAIFFLTIQVYCSK